MAFATADERTKANALARDMKALLPRLHHAVGNMETLQTEDLSALDLVGGGSSSEHLRAARKLLRDASTAWENAKRALRTDENLLAAVAQYEIAVRCFTQANDTLVLLGAPNANVEPVKDDKTVKPSGKTDKTSEPAPVPTPKPTDPVKPAEDKKGKDDPKIDPDPKPEPPKAKDKEKGEPEDPFAKVLAAINGVQEACASQHKALTDRLDILAAGTLPPARAKAIREISDEQFENLMRLVGMLTPTGLSTLEAFINLTDEQFSQIMTAGGLVARVSDLETWREAGVTLGDSKFLKGKLWNRRDKATPASTDEPDPTTH